MVANKDQLHCTQQLILSELTTRKSHLHLHLHLVIIWNSFSGVMVNLQMQIHHVILKFGYTPSITRTLFNSRTN